MPLGIIRPCANLAYFYYSDNDWLDAGLYAVYWPCQKIFPAGAVPLRDRVYPKLEDMDPEGEE